MHHVAIMKKSWGLLPKILLGEKKIESRWYKTRCEAWGKVKAGDVVWFKDSGCPITISAGVTKVLQFEDLNPGKVKEIIYRYGGKDGIASDDLEYFCEWAKNKKYCVLVFLENPRLIDKPFNVNKKGFGSARAWLTMPDISAIRL